VGGVTTASLCLAAGSLLDADPFVLADAAAAAGFDGIGLRLSHDHALDAAGLQRLAAHIGNLGLTVHDVEVHRIGTGDANGPGDDVGPLVDAAATVGARHLLVVSDLADNPSGREHTVHRLGAVVDRCRAAGLVAGIEYMAWTTPRRSVDAVAMAAATGAVVVVDLLHHTRLGEGADELRAVVASGRLGWVQVCDAPATAPVDLLDEARHRRLPPGDGRLPLDVLLAEVPADVVRSVEVQSDAMAARLAPVERAAALYAAATRGGHPAKSTG
jgi:sugar phosphate isomerase/epimerase